MLMLAGAAIGAVGGLMANGRRQSDAFIDLQKAKYIAEEQKKNRDRAKRIIAGNITAGALSDTANSREQAMQAFQAESGQEAALGTSGVSAGTPFYKLDQDIRDNMTRLNEASELARTNRLSRGMQAAAQSRDYTLQDAQAEWSIGAMQGEMNYLESPFAAVMSAGAGAFQGASVAAGLERFAYENGILSDVGSIDPQAVDAVSDGVIPEVLPRAASRYGESSGRNPDPFRVNPAGFSNDMYRSMIGPEIGFGGWYDENPIAFGGPIMRPQPRTGGSMFAGLALKRPVNPLSGL